MAEGYNYEFVDDSYSKYTCAICTLVACEAQQTRCCGNLYCNGCVQQLRNVGNNFNCPTCRVGLADNYYPDQRADREIKFLQVYCNNKDDGCQWKGDLKDIEDHLQECPDQLVSCSNDCGMDSLQRRHLQNHLENDCPKRLIKCQYCNKEGRHQVITGDHLGVCPEYPTRCTNEGCGRLIPCQQMPSHKASCPKEIIYCGYRSVGCNAKFKRDLEEKHDKLNMKMHLQLGVREVVKLKLEIETLSSQILQCSCLIDGEVNDDQPCHIVKLTGFGSLKCNSSCWFSPGFYTSPGGYRMCLCVYANGDGIGEDTHVSCYIRLMSGEYDDILEWPFHGEVTIELLNQLEDENHHKRVVHFDESRPCAQECISRVIGKEISVRGRGFSKFLSHSQLHFKSSFGLHYYQSCQYLKDDTLYFRVSAKVTSNTKPWLAYSI